MSKEREEHELLRHIILNAIVTMKAHLIQMNKQIEAMTSALNAYEERWLKDDQSNGERDKK